MDDTEDLEKSLTSNPNLCHLLFANESVGSEKKDSKITEKLIELFNDENRGELNDIPVLSQIGVDKIKQIAIGPKHLAVLLEDNNVVRMSFSISKVKFVKEEVTEASNNSSSLNPPPPSSVHQPTRSNSSKYRRVMLSNSLRSYCRFRGDARSVIIGGPRSLVHSMNVPEDLINNVQQVLQGKSREVIIRELQRTGLNVNEAVNNLLSRDDGDEVIDLSNEPILPDELLQLLEHSSALTASAAITSGNGNDQNDRSAADPLGCFVRDLRTATNGQSKKKDKKKKDDEAMKDSFVLDNNIEWWCGENGKGIPQHALDNAIDQKDMKISPIVSISATSWNLYVLHQNGKVYSWNWNESHGSEEPCEIVSNKTFDSNENSASQYNRDPVIMLSTSNLRISVLTSSGSMVSWLDELAVGLRVREATQCMGSIPKESLSNVHDFTTSDFISSIRVGNNIYWLGLYPPTERVKLFEKEKSHQKKHVSFMDKNSGTASFSTNNDISVGSLVQLKKSPIYPAGSVGIFLDTCEPMIGVLLEDSWSNSESCRFRVLTVQEFDDEMHEKDEIMEEVHENDENVKSSTTEQSSRKRKAQDSPASVEKNKKIAMWSVDDVSWIHEHRKGEVMTVNLIDNNLISVTYDETVKPMPFASIYSDRLGEETDRKFEEVKKKKVRLMRKDDVQLYSRKTDGRFPKVLQKELHKISFDSSKNLISMVSDRNGFRVLARVKNEPDLFLCRLSISGKILTKRRLPLFAPTIERMVSNGRKVQLFSFGDNRTCFLRDSTGQIVPLLRDSLLGYKEPPIVHSQPISLISSLARPINNVVSACEKGSAWESSLVVLPGTRLPYHRKLIRDGASLMQLILYCDYDGVLQFLEKVVQMRTSNTISAHEYRQLMNEQLFENTSDGCSNVLQAAIRLCMPLKHSLDIDKRLPDGEQPKLFKGRNEKDEDDDTGEFGDDSSPGRWKGVLRGRTRRSKESPGSRTKRKRISGEGKNQTDENDCSEESMSSSSLKDYNDIPYGSAVSSTEARQLNAMNIVDLLLKHTAIFYDKDAKEETSFEDEEDPLSTIKCLLSSRDYSGKTAFMLSVYLRTYGAAYSVWRTLLKLNLPAMKHEEQLKYIFPAVIEDSNFNPDSSPLFVLCYNDVCSFTWTGEDHINQDIYECKTCGIFGTLCCCSECALTCHRNHDCKLKKTSPTAYCDCWEKCACKALVPGNEKLRETILVQLLKYTKLYEMPNSRNEHLLLFLCKTVIRQIKEQGAQSKKRSCRYRTNLDTNETATSSKETVSPPQFSKYALNMCCRNLDVVKSAIDFGAIPQDLNTMVPLNNATFAMQQSSSQLDKLVFALVNRKIKDYSNSFIDTLKSASKSSGKIKDECILRFLRSVIRIIVVAINITPAACSVIMTGEETADQLTYLSKDREDKLRIINTFSGILPYVKKDNSKTNDKAAKIVSLVERAISMLKKFPVLSSLELAHSADSVFAPVRYGLVKAMASPLIGVTHDPVDALDRYFSSDLPFAEVIKKSKKDEKHVKSDAPKKSRKARRDTENDRRESGEDDATTIDHDDRTESEDNRSDPILDYTQRMSSLVNAARENEEQFLNRDFANTEDSAEDDDDDMDEDDDDDDDDDDEDSEENGANNNYLNDDDDEEERNEGESNWLYENASSPSEGDDDEEDDRDRSSNSNDDVDENRSTRDGETTNDASRGQSERNDVDVLNTDSSRFGISSTFNSSETNSEANRSSTSSRVRHMVSLRNSLPRPTWPIVRTSQRNESSGQSSSTAVNDTNRRTEAREGNDGSTSSGNNNENNQNSSTSNNNQSTSSSKKSVEVVDIKAGEIIARRHLALTFSLLVRLGCNMLKKMIQPVEIVFTEKQQNIIEHQNQVCRSFNDILDESFSWMFMVMDSTEAKLRFNESYMAQIENTPSNSVNSTSDKRKSALNYVTSLLKMYQNESKDRLADVDFEILEPCALVLDAYLVFLNCSSDCNAEFKIIVDQFDESWKRAHKLNCTATDRDLMTAFFVRPWSLSYPGDLLEGAWDTVFGRDGLPMMKIEKDIPLVERSDLLTFDATSTGMFRPVDIEGNVSMKSILENKTDNMYTKTSRSLLNMSLSLSQSQTNSRMLMSEIKNNSSHSPSDEKNLKEMQDESKCSVEQLRKNLREYSTKGGRILFSKWQRAIGVMTEQHYDSIAESFGAELSVEVSPLLKNISRFGKRQQQFMSSVEKYKSLHSSIKEMTMDVHRDPAQLIRGTITYLNQLYTKRTMSIRSNDATHCVLAGTRLRVRFIDEPGEGTGVTRSFYTAFAEACTQLKCSPFSSNLSKNEKDQLIVSLNFPSLNEFQTNKCTEATHRIRKQRREKAQRFKSSLEKLRPFPLNLAVPPADLKQMFGREDWKQNDCSNLNEIIECYMKTNKAHLKRLSDAVAKMVNSMKMVERITGIIFQLPPDEFKACFTNDDSLRLYVQHICVELRAESEFYDLSDAPATTVMTSTTSANSDGQVQTVVDDVVWLEASGDDGNFPLFTKTPQGSFYTPVVGNGSPLRISAFRNVGRIIGICLLQSEIFPLRLSRHVLAFILRQPVTWLDLGFYDPQLFNSLRSLMCSDQDDDNCFDCINFTATTSCKADGQEKINVVNLKPDGDKIDVDKNNVIEYVYLLSDYILLGENIAALEAIRDGVLDVLPEKMFSGLSPEDLRLILCGTENVSVETLQANTTFLDESRASSEVLSKFKQWFWQVVESLSPQEKQDLVFFWTGSPTLPSSGDFHTNATVMLRPPDDMFLPTANTCISRLYVPVYSTKRILKSKLLLAIKAKNFGFV